MVTAQGLYWTADFGEIAEAEQFRVGSVGDDLYSAYFPVGQLQDLITSLTNVIPLGLGVLSLGTQVQSRKVSTGFHTEVVIEPRSDTFPPQIMRAELTTLSDLISVLSSLQALIAGQEPADWDGSKIKPISYSALPPELSPEQLTATIESIAAPLDARTFGAKGDDSTDDTAALQALLTYSSTQPRTRYIPPGTYRISAGLTMSPTLNLSMAPGATIKAVATIAGPMIQTVVGTLMEDRFIEGGVLDCNGFADNGLYIRNFANLQVTGTRVHNAKGDAFIFNDPAVASTSYEVHGTGLNVTRDPSVAVPSGSVGIRVDSTDSTFIRCVVQGQDVGIRNQQSYNRFFQCHAWGYNGKLPTTCFYDTGWGTSWVDCDADTPATYGWYVTGRYTQYSRCRVFINGYGVDNTVTGVYSTDSAPAMNVSGFIFLGIDSSHRLLRDFGGTPGLGGNYTLIGLTQLNVANNAAPVEDTISRIRLTSSLTINSDAAASFALRDSTGVSDWVKMDAASTPKRLQFLNGIPVSGYADGGPTETFRLSASSGTVRPGTATGVGAALNSGSGAPSSGMGANGDFYFRLDTPGTANQRLYVKSAGAWVGII